MSGDRNRRRLSAQPWWTAADEAELAVLANAFVCAVFAHRERCPDCVRGRPWCPQLRDAWDALWEWRQARRLLSEAEWLRAQQELRTFAHELGVSL